MAKQVREQRGERELERGIEEEKRGRERFLGNIQLQEVAAKRRERELAPKIQAQEEAKRERFINQLPEWQRPYARLKVPIPSKPPETPGEAEEAGKIKEAGDIREGRLKKHQSLLKVARSRLEKERTTLSMKSRPNQAELTSGLMPEKKKAFMVELKNVEDGLNLLGKMESYMTTGTPLGKRQWGALKKILGDIGGVRTGKTLEDIRSSWAEEARITPDKHGFKKGEIKQDATGQTWKYIGNNQWQLVK